MRLSDSIEQFIKAMITQEEQEIELKRNELAQYFGCAPSQINYVLSTRFTPAHGYLIESHRGGGGCIRIYRLQPEAGETLVSLFNEQIGTSIDALTAEHLIGQLAERGLIAQGEAAVMNAAISREAMSLPIPEDVKNALRAKMLKQMLKEAARTGDQPKKGE